MSYPNKVHNGPPPQGAIRAAAPLTQIQATIPTFVRRGWCDREEMHKRQTGYDQHSFPCVYPPCLEGV